MRSTSLCQILALSFASPSDAYCNLPASHRTNTALKAELGVPPHFGRRKALHSLLGGAFGIITGVPAARALDMDAFANSQLESDSKNCNPKLDPKCFPKLTQDEGLCKYGQSGSTARAEACKRVKAQGGDLPSNKPQGKSLGGAYAM